MKTKSNRIIYICFKFGLNFILNENQTKLNHIYFLSLIRVILMENKTKSSHEHP